MIDIEQRLSERFHELRCPSGEILFNSFSQIFQMHQFPAIAIFLKQCNRIAPTEVCPKNIHFKGYVSWICIGNNVVQQSVIFKWLELVTVYVVAKDDCIFFQNFSSGIKISHCFF